MKNFLLVSAIMVITLISCELSPPQISNSIVGSWKSANYNTPSDISFIEEGRSGAGVFKINKVGIPMITDIFPDTSLGVNFAYEITHTTKDGGNGNIWDPVASVTIEYPFIYEIIANNYIAITWYSPSGGISTTSTRTTYWKQ